MLTRPDISESLQRQFITTLGDSAHPQATRALIDTLEFFSQRTTPPQNPGASNLVLDQILKRPEAALGLLAALQEGKMTPAKLGPTAIARLRTHPNRRVALQAATVFEVLSPQTKQKSELVARLLSEVEQPGDAAQGKTLFAAACASCHRFGELGQLDVGPPLDGIGTHGPAELLTHILDPNREVDPSFSQWNIVTKTGENRVGVIISENSTSLTLRNQSGDLELRKADIATRENTTRSLMPEGLEGLGATGLRDLLAFIRGGPQKFRVLDLREAYTADSRRGSFRQADQKDETVALHKFGQVTVSGVPFFIMDPARATRGTNYIALKGGPGSGTVSADYPQHSIFPRISPRRVCIFSVASAPGRGLSAVKPRRANPP